MRAPTMVYSHRIKASLGCRKTGFVRHVCKSPWGRQASQSMLLQTRIHLHGTEGKYSGRNLIVRFRGGDSTDEGVKPLPRIRESGPGSLDINSTEKDRTTQSVNDANKDRGHRARPSPAVPRTPNNTPASTPSTTPAPTPLATPLSSPRKRDSDDLDGENGDEKPSNDSTSNRANEARHSDTNYSSRHWSALGKDDADFDAPGERQTHKGDSVARADSPKTLRTIYDDYVGSDDPLPMPKALQELCRRLIMTPLQFRNLLASKDSSLLSRTPEEMLESYKVLELVLRPRRARAAATVNPHLMQASADSLNDNLQGLMCTLQLPLDRLTRDLLNSRPSLLLLRPNQLKGKINCISRILDADKEYTLRAIRRQPGLLNVKPDHVETHALVSALMQLHPMQSVDDAHRAIATTSASLDSMSDIDVDWTGSSSSSSVTANTTRLGSVGGSSGGGGFGHRLFTPPAALPAHFPRQDAAARSEAYGGAGHAEGSSRGDVTNAKVKGGDPDMEKRTPPEHEPSSGGTSMGLQNLRRGVGGGSSRGDDVAPLLDDVAELLISEAVEGQSGRHSFLPRVPETPPNSPVSSESNSQFDAAHGGMRDDSPAQEMSAVNDSPIKEVHAVNGSAGKEIRAVNNSPAKGVRAVDDSPSKDVNAINDRSGTDTIAVNDSPVKKIGAVNDSPAEEIHPLNESPARKMNFVNDSHVKEGDAIKTDVVAGTGDLAREACEEDAESAREDGAPAMEERADVHRKQASERAGGLTAQGAVSAKPEAPLPLSSRTATRAGGAPLAVMMLAAASFVSDRVADVLTVLVVPGSPRAHPPASSPRAVHHIPTDVKEKIHGASGHVGSARSPGSTAEPGTRLHGGPMALLAVIAALAAVAAVLVGAGRR